MTIYSDDYYKYPFDEDDFIDWLGYAYLDFQNESQEWRDIARKEIKEKLKELKQ